MVQVEKIEEQTKGGIILTKDHIDREQNAASEGVITDVGPTAFDYLDEDRRPKIADSVLFVKYSGIGKTVNDNEMRIMNDGDIAGIVEYEDE